jgi:hypothetical protein
MKQRWIVAALALLLATAAVRAEESQDYLPLTLGQLGVYTYVDYSDGAPAGSKAAKKRVKHKNQIPKDIQRLDGAKISIVGFMIPYNADGDYVLDFTLVKSLAICCYGVTPKINETIHCNVPKELRIKMMVNVPLKLYGTLKVGEVWDNGYLLALYRMTVDKMEKASRQDLAEIRSNAALPRR